MAEHTPSGTPPPTVLTWTAYAKKRGGQATPAAYETYLKRRRVPTPPTDTTPSDMTPVLPPSVDIPPPTDRPTSTSADNERAHQVLRDYTAMIESNQRDGAPLLSERAFAKKHGVAASTFRKWRAQDRPVKRSGRAPSIPRDLEKQLEEMALGRLRAGEPFSWKDLRVAATAAARAAGFARFQASNGWLEQFLNRATDLKAHAAATKEQNADKELFIVAALKRAKILPLNSTRAPTILQLKALADLYIRPMSSRVLKRSEYVEQLNDLLDPTVRLDGLLPPPLSLHVGVPELPPPSAEELLGEE
ncbi:Aste57867_25456 [Aphanomyces stellatus]|uniref:Aste57867_25456 protein n=1 Tax=Aphanomyces stellatus TaxID=120398 RepID=A0A485LT94_9STRA|nr:hypothetical protein As57867_025377 [Aphanomyces stellatus]VFU02079.1 Aste57867_25456 [Aphanomyces stellatus]